MRSLICLFTKFAFISEKNCSKYRRSQICNCKKGIFGKTVGVSSALYLSCKVFRDWLIINIRKKHIYQTGVNLPESHSLLLLI